MLKKGDIYIYIAPWFLHLHDALNISLSNEKILHN